MQRMRDWWQKLCAWVRGPDRPPSDLDDWRPCSDPASLHIDECVAYGRFLQAINWTPESWKRKDERRS